MSEAWGIEGLYVEGERGRCSSRAVAGVETPQKSLLKGQASWLCWICGRELSREDLRIWLCIHSTYCILFFLFPSLGWVTFDLR